MPNLSPVNVRDKYKLYDNKICTGDEAAECRYCMENRMKSIGYRGGVARRLRRYVITIEGDKNVQRKIIKG